MEMSDKQEEYNGARRLPLGLRVYRFSDSQEQIRWDQEGRVPGYR